MSVVLELLRGADMESTSHKPMDWQPLDSKKLAAVACVPETGILYLRFRIGEIYAYFPFIDAQHQEFLLPNRVAATSSATPAANSATSALPSHKSLKQSRRPPSDAYTRTPVVVFVIDVRRIGVTGRYSGFRQERIYCHSGAT